ncbi:MAG TPA: hypothetical protein VGR53_06495 [Nitrososphaerales archaeon]|nr:hypothetical protein [Nitrososphaerales archaeon]
MNRDKLVRMEQNFHASIMPLMDENGKDDYDLVWEFEKYLDSKKDEVASIEKQAVRKWQAPLLGK